MPISRKEVEWVAYLSRLELEDEMSERMTRQLGSILDYIAKLEELDTSGVEPMPRPVPMSNVFREDEPAPSIDRADALRNAPDQRDGQFRVPRVIE